MTAAERQLLPWKYLLSAGAKLLKGRQGAWRKPQNTWGLMFLPEPLAGHGSNLTLPVPHGRPGSGGSGVWVDLGSKGPQA